MYILNVSALARQAGVSADSVRSVLEGNQVRRETIRKLARTIGVEPHFVAAYLVALHQGDWQTLHDISFHAARLRSGV